jgi:hypothetical protein
MEIAGPSLPLIIVGEVVLLPRPLAHLRSRSLSWADLGSGIGAS